MSARTIAFIFLDSAHVSPGVDFLLDRPGGGFMPDINQAACCGQLREKGEPVCANGAHGESGGCARGENTAKQGIGSPNPVVTDHEWDNGKAMNEEGDDSAGNAVLQGEATA